MQYSKKALPITVTLFVAALVLLLFVQHTTLSEKITTLEKTTGQLNTQLAAMSTQRCEAIPQPSNTLSTHTLESSGGTRSFLLHTPANYAYNTKTPVIIAYDGKDGSAQKIAEYSGLSSLPALVIYPQALIGTTGVTAWEGAPYSPPGVSDVSFTQDIITWATENYCVDESAIYTVGMSNGAGIAWLAACTLPGAIAAAVGVSGAYYTDCQPSKPISSLFIHSENDANVPYAGSTRRHLPNIRAWATQRATQNNCYAEPVERTIPGGTLSVWALCNSNTSVQLLGLHDGEHGWLYLPHNSKAQEQQSISYYIRQFLSL